MWSQINRIQSLSNDVLGVVMEFNTYKILRYKKTGDYQTTDMQENQNTFQIILRGRERRNPVKSNIVQFILYT